MLYYSSGYFYALHDLQQYTEFSEIIKISNIFAIIEGYFVTQLNTCLSPSFNTLLCLN